MKSICTIRRYLPVAIALTLLSQAAGAAPELAASAPAASASAAQAAACAAGCEVHAYLLNAVCGGIFAIGLWFLLTLRSRLEKLGWRLGDAMTEEVKAVVLERDAEGKPTGKLLTDTDSGKPYELNQMKPSTSRLIAFVGSFFITLLFLGFGIFALFRFAKSGVLPDMTGILTFLTGGMTLFVPYALNKISESAQSKG